MPIYEYICKKCKKTFEIFQKITEKQKTKCPKCRGRLKKLISQSAFHLKGTGWSKTSSEAKDTKKTGTEASPQSSQACDTSLCNKSNPHKSAQSDGSVI